MNQPTILDRLVLMQRDLDVMKQQLEATAQVVEAVGNAVGQMYVQNQNLLETLKTEVPPAGAWTPDNGEDY